MITLEELKKNLAILLQQKEQALLNFHQIIGAITLIEQMINNDLDSKKDVDLNTEESSKDLIDDKSSK